MGMCCALNHRGIGQTEHTPLTRDVQLGGSVGLQGKNALDDVSAVQRLLNNATAVAGAPPKPITVDGLIGPETIGAIKTFQSKMLGFADGRVDPNNKTIAKLNSLVPANGPAKTDDSVFSSDLALQCVPLATSWSFMGLMHLFGLFQLTQGTGPTANDITIANTHFHLDRDAANLKQNLIKLIGVYNLILQTLANGRKFFADGPLNPKSPFADAPMGGFHLPGTVSNFITFRPGYKTCGPKTRTAMVVHECAHFVGGLNEISHFAMEFPFPNGQPQGDGNTRNYAELRTDEAMRNASSYAAFAIHVFHNADLRFGAADITQ